MKLEINEEGILDYDNYGNGSFHEWHTFYNEEEDFYIKFEGTMTDLIEKVFGSLLRDKKAKLKIVIEVEDDE